MIAEGITLDSGTVVKQLIDEVYVVMVVCFVVVVVCS